MNTTDFDDGGTAFPATEQHGCNSGMPGMSLRQHYAGLAMAALITQGFDMESAAPSAIATADAMIRAGHNPPQQVERPFDPTTLTNDELAALDRLTGWLYFEDLPADLKQRAKATAEYLKSDASDYSIPF